MAAATRKSTSMVEVKRCEKISNECSSCGENHSPDLPVYWITVGINDRLSSIRLCSRCIEVLKKKIAGVAEGSRHQI